MKKPVRYATKALCPCGFSVLADHIPIGQQYSVDLPGEPGSMICEGCQAKIPVMLVSATRAGIPAAGVLPLEIFKPL